MSGADCAPADEDIDSRRRRRRQLSVAGDQHLSNSFDERSNTAGRLISRRRSSRLDSLLIAYGSSPYAADEKDNVCESSEDETDTDTLENEDTTATTNNWYCWLVLAASFFTLVVLDGINYSFGVLLEPLMDAIGGGTESIAMAGSLQTCVYATTGIIASKLTDRFGTRLVCVAGNLMAAIGLVAASFSWNLVTFLLTYSLITGVGFGLMYIPAILAVAHHFKTQRSLALGISLCGTGAGTFVFAPLESSILANLGLRATILILGVICFAGVACALVLRPVQSGSEATAEQTQTASTSENYVAQDQPRPPARLREITLCGWLTRVASALVGEQIVCHDHCATFWLVCLADSLGTMALYVPFIYLPTVAQGSGIQPTQAALLVSCIGLASSVGRVASGLANDQPWSDPLLLTAIVVPAAGCQALLIAWCSTYTSYMAFSLAYGLTTGVWIGSTTPLIIDIFSLDLLAPAFGVMTALQGFSALVGAPIAGLFVDHLHSPEASLIFAGGLLLLSTLFFALGHYLLKRAKRRADYTWFE